MVFELRRFLASVLHRHLLLDLEDRLAAEAAKALEMVREYSGLRPKRARELIGQARFRMMEQGFEDVCSLHGGALLAGGVIPGTELPVFQPFMRFEVEGTGIILGLASMPEPKKIPTKNRSRLAGVTLNYHLEPTLDLDGGGPKIGDIFVLLLVARDRERPGLLEEVAVGVIDARYSTLLFYEPLNRFLGESGAAPEAPTPDSPAAIQSSGVTLKKGIKPFVPPEAPKDDDETGEA